MDVTHYEDALVALEPVWLRAGDVRLRDAAGTLIAMILDRIEVLTEGTEVVMDEPEDPHDSTPPARNGKGAEFRPAPETKTPRPEGAGRKAGRGR